MKNTTIINRNAYDEATMLINLKHNLYVALDKQVERYAKGDATLDTITVTVNDIAHEFVLGGPQSMGIEAFINHICDENGYELEQEHDSLLICDTCRMAIESRGETVNTIDTMRDADSHLTCGWCDESGFDTLYKVSFK